MKNLLLFYTSFKGRATRYDFNVLYALVLFAGSIVATIIDLAMAGWDYNLATHQAYATLGWNLLIILPTFAVTARRLHDVNLSGWWQILLYVPALYSTIYFEMNEENFNEGLFTPLELYGLLAVLVFYLATLIFFSTKRGTIGPNKYGADLLGETNV